MNFSYKIYNLPFRHPFTISKGTKPHQPVFVVRLDYFGLSGFGEAPAISYYNIPVEKMVSDLEAKRPFVEKFSFSDPERYWHYLHHLFPANPFLVCALDMAGWDFFGKMKRKQLHELWNLDLEDAPLTDYTIGLDSLAMMKQKIQEKPWPIYKIKLGTYRDIEIMEALRKHTDAVFRIDANAAWKAEEALEKINAFSRMGVEFIEQPLAKEDWDGMKWLYEQSPLPLYADESCVVEQDVEKCAGHFHGINIKLTKCSGLTPALRMIENARKLGLKIMVGAMNESTLGSAAIAHLMPLIDHVDADGPLLLEEDIATGLTYLDNGEIHTSPEPGLGIKFTGLYQK